MGNFLPRGDGDGDGEAIPDREFPIAISNQARSSVNTALIQIYMMFYDFSSQIS